MSDSERAGRRRPDPSPAQRFKVKFTVNQLVAYNITYFRKAAGLTQEELGERLGGWSAASVSAAERSWDGKRARKFDADELVMIAAALGVPLPGLFLPPDEGGPNIDFVLDVGIPGQETVDLVALVLPTDAGDSPVMEAYRKRLIAVGARPGSRQCEVQDENRDAMAPLVQEQERLERRIDDLRAFEREYRVRLRHYLEVQFRDLLGPEMGANTDRIIEALREEAAERGASRVSAVILREDGTYQQVQALTEPEAESEDEP